jgi:hypothetical protein
MPAQGGRPPNRLLKPGAQRGNRDAASRPAATAKAPFGSRSIETCPRFPPTPDLNRRADSLTIEDLRRTAIFTPFRASAGHLLLGPAANSQRDSRVRTKRIVAIRWSGMRPSIGDHVGAGHGGAVRCDSAWRRSHFPHIAAAALGVAVEGRPSNRHHPAYLARRLRFAVFLAKNCASLLSCREVLT